MKFDGEVTIQAPREKVWAFLTNPEAVAACAPGVESMEVVEEGKKFKAVASVGMGNLKARFNADVEWVELDEPNSAVMKAHGVAPGSAADVQAEMTLSDGADGTTRMQWTADINIMGTIASLAARMMGSVTKKLTAEFFDCMQAQIEA
jgi:carbon monoxide dehydrogenase subunit G